MGFAIGIDLGTANTRIAVHRHDHFEVIPHEGQSLMPSYVAFTETGRLIGQAAKNQASVNPKNTVFNVLSFLGTAFNSPHLQAMIKLLSFEVTHDGAIAEEKRKPVFKVTHKGVPTTFTPVEILAMILKRAKKDAERYLGHRVFDALITLPSYFNLSQRFAIKDAATIAGIRTLRMMPAASVALTDLMITQKMPGERNVIICDVGAGYYSVVLATLEEGIQDTKAVSWDDSCVGEDYDRRMMNHMINFFNRKYRAKVGESVDSTFYGLTDNPRALRRLRAACEKAKHQLSSAEEAVIEIEQLHGGNDLNMFITRARFEELIQDLVRSLCEPIERVLRDAKLEKSSVHDIVLIGGSSRIPKIQKVISNFFDGKEPIRCLNIEETSARGAALHAAIISSDKTSRNIGEILLLDIVSWSLGIETAGGVMTPLIKRGTSIPTKKSEVFSTYQDNQDFFLVTCYEGERARVKDCKELGHTQVPVPPAPRGVPQLEVTFYIDADYIITATVLEKSTGSKSSVILNGNNARSFARISNERLESLTRAEEQMEAEDEREDTRIEARNTAEELMYSFKDWTSTIPEERRVDGIARLENLANIVLNWMDENQSAATWEYETQRGGASTQGGRRGCTISECDDEIGINA
ncbi:hypothetical protein BDV96DRAFT_610321 [Lophiotrema nucula]|uniref:Heat shock protein 70 family n=1 Tax=Lophiotrema nucula TaxID=690887 RepID=A0A6A5ZL58_9PLEO|nr:hypothetical protein BDV96DRAFT_610321 [Lophiotrema nucula]